MVAVIDTPCIGVCSTVYGDDICRGCKRRATEVIAWNTYSQTEKAVIFSRLGQLVAAHTAEFFTIIDQILFADAIQKYQIRQCPGYPDYCQVYYLIRCVLDKTNDLLALGLKQNSAYRALDLHHAFKTLDDNILQAAHRELDACVAP